MTMRFTALPVESMEDVTLNFEQIAAGPLAQVLFGAGVPASTLGSDGQVYLRSDGAAGAFIYQKRAGAWVASTA